MSQDKKLGFQVVFASGEDAEYPVTELNFHSPQTKGWQSPRFCEYPQEIGIQFTDGAVNISQVQLLSHQSKIATKIELFHGEGDDYYKCRFSRLGYLSLDSNERSQYKARELKSVYLKAQGSFLKLLLHKCYLNPLNLFNQVGLIAINVLGQPAAVPLPVQPLRGALPAAGGQRAGSGAGVNDLAVDMGMDPETAAVLREVVARKEAAVADEEFELAKRLKVLQDGIKRVGGTLAALAADKSRAVEEEDYDRAARLKDDMGRIRSAIFDQMAELGLGGGGTGPRAGAGGVAQGHGNGGGGYPRNAGPTPVQPSFDPLYAGSDSAGPKPMPDRIGPVGQSGMPSGGAGVYPGFNAPGSADRPIRPAATTDIYARAGVSPARGSPRGGSENEGEGGGYGAGRPASRPIRPTKEGLMEEIARTDTTTRGGGVAIPDPDVAVSPFGKRSAVGGGGPLATPAMAERAADPEALAGVDGAADLPAPDPMPNNAGEAGARLVELFGDYVARCYYSKTWSLREAAILKMALETPRVSANGGPGKKTELLLACAPIVTAVLSKERIANIVISSCHDLLPSLAANVCTGPDAVRRGEAASALDPVLAGLVERLGDNTPKVREAAVQGLLALSAVETLGVVHVAGALLRRPGKKQAANTRSLQSKLEVLTLLAEQHGLLTISGGISPDVLVDYCEENATFAHANGEIRHAALELMVAVAKVSGGGVVEPMLQPLLRKKQFEEYKAAFLLAGVPPGPVAVFGGSGTGPAEPVEGERGARAEGKGVKAGVKKVKEGKADPKETEVQGKGKGGKAAGKGDKGEKGGKAGAASSAPGPPGKPAPGKPAPAPVAAPADLAEEVASGVCQFCGQCGPNASEQELDLHYWQSCPMLTSCGRCQQVIEIATLVEHLLDECDSKGLYEACVTCGDAILSADLAAHTEAAECKAQPDPTVASRCALCHADIPPDKEGWLHHLLDTGCPANPRTNGSPKALPAV